MQKLWACLHRGGISWTLGIFWSSETILSWVHMRIERGTPETCGASEIILSGQSVKLLRSRTTKDLSYQFFRYLLLYFSLLLLFSVNLNGFPPCLDSMLVVRLQSKLSRDIPDPRDKSPTFEISPNTPLYPPMSHPQRPVISPPPCDIPQRPHDITNVPWYAQRSVIFHDTPWYPPTSRGIPNPPPPMISPNLPRYLASCEQTL